MNEPTLFRHNEVVFTDHDTLQMFSPLSAQRAEYAVNEITDAPIGGLFAHASFKDAMRSACCSSRLVAVTTVKPVTWHMSVVGNMFIGCGCDLSDIRRFWKRYTLEDLIAIDNLATVSEYRIILCKAVLTTGIVGVWLPQQRTFEVKPEYVADAEKQAKAMSLNGCVQAVSDWLWPGHKAR